MATKKRCNTNRFQQNRYRLLISIIVLSMMAAIYVGIRAGRAASGKDATMPNFANPTSTVFINEILYDVTGTDAGEFIEVAAPAGTNMADYSIVLYNGSGGALYDTDALSGITTNQQGGYGTVSISYPSNGIQNGAPDGVALINTSTNTLVQFLCYEGTFAGVGGLANGITCTDIGVSQSGTNALGTSLQLQGTGTTYGDFVWNATSLANTQNAPNTGQTFTGGGTPTPTPTPSLSVNDVTQAEGNVGTTTFTFTVSLSSAALSDVTFDIATADGTAQDGNPGGEDTDYIAKSETGRTITTGNSSTTFTVNVDGDTTGEANETFFVNVTNITGGALAGDTQGLGTITNDDFVIAAIHTIQGSGDSSPFNSQAVTTRGIVTLLKTNGYFLQEPDATADADPNTSEGIFVFTSSAPTVAVGHDVTVSGTVSEFGTGGTNTEIINPTGTIINSTGNGLPTAVVLTTTILDPTAPPGHPQLEKYEDMLMTGSLTTVAPNDSFFDVYTVLSTVARPLREPGIEISLPAVPPDPTSGVPDCCIPRWDENSERLSVDTNGRAGSTGVAITSSVSLGTITGPLDFAFAEYHLIPESNPVISNISAIPVPTPLANEFTVANFNIENFANGITQRLKASLAIRNVMRYPDIIGHEEILDLASLQALATQVNSDTVTAGDPNPVYVAYLIPAPSGGTQHVGFLVKSARVQVNSVTQERAAETYINPLNGLPETLHDRPPLVLKATVDPNGLNPRTVIVVVNHPRSFIDVDQDPGDGPRVRAKRKAQGESIADLMQQLQTNNPG